MPQNVTPIRLAREGDDCAKLPEIAGRRRYLRAGAREAAMRRAAALVWDDRLTDRAIAEECGMSRRTLSYWREQPGFQALVEAERQEWYRRNGRTPLGI